MTTVATSPFGMKRRVLPDVREVIPELDWRGLVRTRERRERNCVDVYCTPRGDGAGQKGVVGVCVMLSA